MKINKITLFNIGPYYGKNVFNITNGKQKNIVLIGGKNGAGKTTFFDSIRTCLYGYKAYGFETTSVYYLNEISKLINDLVREQNDLCSYVEIDLLLDDGMDNNVYTLRRMWNQRDGKLSEDFSVSLNDNKLSDLEVTDFNDYLMHLIPLSLFKYYFFDGEKIAQFFLKKYSDDSFKNAFLTMTGYDNIQIMVKNFKRNAVSVINNSKSKANNYFEQLSKHEKLNEKIKDLSNEILQSNDKIIFLRNEIKQLENRFKNSGGISKKQIDDINKQILFEEANRELMHKQRKEFCNTEIPYLILHDKIITLAKQIKLEQDSSSVDGILKLINHDNLIDSMKNSNLTMNQKENLANQISQYYRRNFKTNTNNFLHLSDAEITQIKLLIESHKTFNPQIINELYSKIKQSIKLTRNLKDKLLNSSPDQFEKFEKTKDEMLKQISVHQTKINTTEIFVENLKTDLAELEKSFKKAKSEYENELKINSVSDVSSRALLAFEEAGRTLLRSQINKIEDEFPNIFKKLINKIDLISGIFIDDQLNIFPYTINNVSIKEAKTFLHENSKTDDYFVKRNISSIENQMKINKNKISIAKEIVSPFSQGEKQIYIMSIYLSLMSLSKISIPYVIDTPFARIDTKHRINIMKNFFNKLKGQAFILSTDEEIVGEYEKMIDSKIANRFLLKYQTRGKTKVFSDKYFKELK